MSTATGEPLSRVDGVAKVTGAARYAAEFTLPDLAHGAIVQSTIAKGRITEMDTSAAERAPGVLAVITHRNAPKLPYQAPSPKPVVDPVIGLQIPMLQDDLVRHNGQHVGMVVAETLEQATYAADLVRVAYEEEPAATSVEAALPHAFPVTEGNEGSGTPAAYRRGDPARALAAAPVTVDQTYVIAHGKATGSRCTTRRSGPITSAATSPSPSACRRSTSASFRRSSAARSAARFGPGRTSSSPPWRHGRSAGRSRSC
jgi:xanthine dehydrogenase YagR molybdenum-binding subunit